MKLVQSILTKNPCYTAGRKITVKGLMLHSVGCSQPKASVFINSWNSASYSNACVMVLSMAMMEQFIRRFLGTIEAGMQVAMQIILISE